MFFLLLLISIIGGSVCVSSKFRERLDNLIEWELPYRIKIEETKHPPNYLSYIQNYPFIDNFINYAFTTAKPLIKDLIVPYKDVFWRYHEGYVLSLKNKDTHIQLCIQSFIRAKSFDDLSVTAKKVFKSPYDLYEQFGQYTRNRNILKYTNNFLYYFGIDPCEYVNMNKEAQENTVREYTAQFVPWLKKMYQNPILDINFFPNKIISYEWNICQYIKDLNYTQQLILFNTYKKFMLFLTEKEINLLKFLDMNPNDQDLYLKEFIKEEKIPKVKIPKSKDPAIINIGNEEYKKYPLQDVLIPVENKNIEDEHNPLLYDNKLYEFLSSAFYPIGIHDNYNIDWYIFTEIITHKHRYSNYSKHFPNLSIYNFVINHDKFSYNMIQSPLIILNILGYLIIFYIILCLLSNLSFLISYLPVYFFLYGSFIPHISRLNFAMIDEDLLYKSLINISLYNFIHYFLYKLNHIIFNLSFLIALLNNKQGSLNYYVYLYIYIHLLMNIYKIIKNKYYSIKNLPIKYFIDIIIQILRVLVIINPIYFYKFYILENIYFVLLFIYSLIKTNNNEIVQLYFILALFFFIITYLYISLLITNNDMIKTLNINNTSDNILFFYIKPVNLFVLSGFLSNDLISFINSSFKNKFPSEADLQNNKIPETPIIEENDIINNKEFVEMIVDVILEYWDNYLWFLKIIIVVYTIYYIRYYIYSKNTEEESIIVNPKTPISILNNNKRKKNYNENQNFTINNSKRLILFIILGSLIKIVFLTNKDNNNPQVFK